MHGSFFDDSPGQRILAGYVVKILEHQHHRLTDEGDEKVLAALDAAVVPKLDEIGEALDIALGPVLRECVTVRWEEWPRDL